MKVLVLCQESDSTWMVLNALTSAGYDVTVGVENPEGRSSFLKRRAKRSGWLNVIGQILFILYAKLLKNLSGGRIRDIVSESGLDRSQNLILPIVKFDSVNDESCVKWIQDVEPDVVLLNGTRIVSGDLIRSVKVPFINTHCGITPRYRGVHGAYWALRQQDKENVGVTLHYVDPGIDTGGVLFQAPIQVTALDNFSTYPYIQYSVAIPLILRALSAIGCGTKLDSFCRHDLESRLWVHPTLWDYLCARVCRGVR